MQRAKQSVFGLSKITHDHGCCSKENSGSSGGIQTNEIEPTGDKVTLLEY